MTKTCTKCKEDKPLIEFGRREASRDGLQSHCKKCEREKARNRYRANPEAQLERTRRYWEKNRDKCSERNRERMRRRNKEVREEAREYAKKHHTKRRQISSSMATKTGRWSQDEVALLIELRKTKTVYQCAIELGRTLSSAEGKVRCLRKEGVDI